MSEQPVKPADLEELRNKPKRIYKLVRTGLFTLDELDRVFELAFGTSELDPENDLHSQMQVAIVEARKAAVVAELPRKREEVKAYMAKGFPGVDVATLDDHVVESIYDSLREADRAAEAQEEIPAIIEKDEEELLLVTPDGEIVGFIDAPEGEVDRRKILEWVGQRLTKTAAKAAGLEAEKNFWIDKICKQYDPLINFQTRLQKRLRSLYEATGQGYLEDMIKGHTGSKELRSVKVGLLTLAFTKTQASTKVVDLKLAIKYCKKNAPEAIKEDVLVSLIPDDKKKKLDPAKHGLNFTPGGADKFSMK